jgi:uncharacterized membrane protein YozB (DUF420 family)
MEMLTKPLISGMNLLSLIGFVLMGIGLTFVRQGKIRAPMAVVLMGLGTALVFAGIYLAPAPTQ